MVKLQYEVSFPEQNTGQTPKTLYLNSGEELDKALRNALFKDKIDIRKVAIRVVDDK